MDVHHNGMLINSRHLRTLRRLHANPVSGTIPWSDIEAMFRHLGATVAEGRGSRVRVLLNGVVAIFHRPHPEKETDKGAVVAVRDFLAAAGITLDDPTRH